MDAKDFFNQFIANFKEDMIDENGKTYLEIYKKESTAFTKLITKIISQIIKEKGWHSQTEYFRIDVIGWESDHSTIKDECARLGMTPHLWDLKIAVEHENNKYDWLDELVKLAHIQCPLKVLIGYASCDERTDIEKEKLALAYTCLSKTKAFDSTANEEFLIILGNGSAHHKSSGSYDKFDYRGYVLSNRNTRFIELFADVNK